MQTIVRIDCVWLRKRLYRLGELRDRLLDLLGVFQVCSRVRAQLSQARLELFALRIRHELLVERGEYGLMECHLVVHIRFRELIAVQNTQLRDVSETFGIERLDRLATALCSAWVQASEVLIECRVIYAHALGELPRRRGESPFRGVRGLHLGLVNAQHVLNDLGVVERLRPLIRCGAWWARARTRERACKDQRSERQNRNAIIDRFHVLALLEQSEVTNRHGIRAVFQAPEPTRTPCAARTSGRSAGDRCAVADRASQMLLRSEVPDLPRDELPLD